MIFIGQSESVKGIHHLIQQVANTPSSVLLLGESGTGKELLARIIHQHSDRKDKPFVPVNCAAIPSELLESELFGHEKGAFTGAYLTRQGRFELAKGGTLFLDEIGDMPLPMQAKLLRVLQEKTFERIGSNQTIHSDIRVIAATHKNLSSYIKEGQFREDLYYRLNVFPIEIPALRERREDIRPLLQYYIDKTKEERGVAVLLHEETVQYLENYEWPGNVRELSNLIERLGVMYPDRTIHVSDLPPNQTQKELKMQDKNWMIMSSPNFDLKTHLSRLELDLITKALQESQGVVAKAAKQLGLRRTTLVEKLRKYGIGRDTKQ